MTYGKVALPFLHIFVDKITKLNCGAPRISDIKIGTQTISNVKIIFLMECFIFV